MVDLAAGKGAADAALGPVIAQNNSPLDLFRVRAGGRGFVLCKECAGEGAADNAGAGQVEKIPAIHSGPVE